MLEEGLNHGLEMLLPMFDTTKTLNLIPIFFQFNK